MKLTARTSNNQVLQNNTLTRREFIKKSGVITGGTAAASALPTLFVSQSTQANNVTEKAKVKTIRSVCTHCSVGCGVLAEVKNGVWVGQEPDFDHPFSLGGHCAKGASVREHGVGERRLKYPMKLVNGKWKKISWDTAINEVGDKMLDIRQKSSSDSVYLLGSAKFNNEQSYLFRKMAALWDGQRFW
jgi:formate dehydrogenase major subunit